MVAISQQFAHHIHAMQDTGASFDAFTIVRSFPSHYLQRIHREAQLRWPAEVAGKKRGSDPDRTHRRRHRATAQAKVHIHRPTAQFLGSVVHSTSPFAVMSSPSFLVSGRPTVACQYTWQRRDRSFEAPSSPLRPRRGSPLFSGSLLDASLDQPRIFCTIESCSSASSQLCFSIDQRQSALKPSYYPGQS